MKIKLTISRQNHAPATTPELRRLLRAAAVAAASACGLTRDAEVSLLFTDDVAIQELNRDYRGRDSATDVLSFALNEDEQGGNDLGASLPGDFPLLLGDIVISYQHAQQQAQAYGHSLLRETVFLFTHGMLHLLGYDHMDEGEEKARMRAREEAILGKLGITRD